MRRSVYTRQRVEGVNYLTFSEHVQNIPFIQFLPFKLKDEKFGFQKSEIVDPLPPLSLQTIKR